MLPSLQHDRLVFLRRLAEVPFLRQAWQGPIRQLSLGCCMMRSWRIGKAYLVTGTLLVAGCASSGEEGSSDGAGTGGLGATSAGTLATPSGTADPGSGGSGPGSPSGTGATGAVGPATVTGGAGGTSGAATSTAAGATTPTATGGTAPDTSGGTTSTSGGTTSTAGTTSGPLGGTPSTATDDGGTPSTPTGGTEGDLGGTSSTSPIGGTAGDSGGTPGVGGTQAETGGATAEPGGTTGDTGGGSTVSGGTSGDTGGTPSETGGTSGDTGGTSGDTGGTSGDPGTVGCDRAGLEAAVDHYLAALEAGDPSLMPLSEGAEYVVNDSPATLAAGQGLFQWAAAPDFHRNLLDVEACRTFTEIICATWSHQYVLGVALSVTEGKISKVYVVETDDGDWSFGADNYLSRSQQEDWSVIPEGERISREELDSGARSYFAYWGDSSVEVPWGDPCARLEGGSFGAFDSPLADTWTEDGQWGSCSVGIPHDGFAPQPRESLIDPDTGMVVLLLNLGGTDSHLFRFEKDESLLPRTGYGYGMVYVHTLTVQ